MSIDSLVDFCLHGALSPVPEGSSRAGGPHSIGGRRTRTPGHPPTELNREPPCQADGAGT